MTPSALGAEGIQAASRILDASIIDQSISRPRVGEWWQELLARVLTFIASLLDFDSSVVRALMYGVAWLVIATAVLALLWFVLSWLRRRGGSEPAAFTVRQERYRLAASDSDDWATQLSAALDHRDVAAALEAMWFLVASRLARDSKGGGAARRLIETKEWTGGRLLAEAGPLRARLSPPVRELERQSYGKQRATIEQVRGLWTKLDKLLPDATTEDAARKGGIEQQRSAQ